MPRSPTHSLTLARTLSIDSLCMQDSQDSPSTAQREYFPPSPPAALYVHHQQTAGNSVMILSASDPTTTMGSKRPAASVHQSKHLDWKTPFFRDKWLWEISCIVFSLACLIAITILSHELDGTWTSKWSFFLQPSTIFSILITGAQSSMIVVISEVLGQLKWLQISLSTAHSVADLATFDSASRGPLGSLRLICRWKPHMNILPPMVYAASLITTGGMAMGPLTQQLISVQAGGWAPTSGINSTTAVANYYNYEPSNRGNPSLQIDGNGSLVFPLSGQQHFNIDPYFQGAFYNGYYQLGEPLIDFNCPSSNCSWPTFNSLGLCSSCQNVTDTAEIIQLERLARITTPRGWTFHIDEGTKVKSIAKISAVGVSLDTISAHLVSTAILQRSPNDSEFFDVRQGLVITECSISWCTKQYSNVTVLNGTLQEYYSIRDVELRPVANQALSGLNTSSIHISTDVYNWPFMLTPDIDGNNVSSPLPPFDHSELNVSLYDHIALSTDLFTKLNFLDHTVSPGFGEGENVSSTLANIANSMTNAIMRSANESVALGMVWQQQYVVKVRWGWLTLPYALVIGSATLLSSMIVASWHYDVPQWKSSPLPLLFHGIRNWNDDEELDLAKGRLERMYAMENRARSKKVQLRKCLGGGRWLAE
ncbi:hypothetical protein KVR01_012446 [Diaporthe batatas]|uniref:uncharacterized protein n=1 Tax=Diaporthe batatas TaxID=748121 RepID=UPI001D04B89C|nr:uncharacterized protein KVR01_012446 [Diaporthe batatas]KAG8157784.1 hypothetical protein KVR01_012446 [Diaporthe batatas]